MHSWLDALDLKPRSQHRRCGTEADVFSFGIMLWELVTQEMPIRGALRDVRVPEECPSPIKCLISRCMASEPARRPTAHEVREMPILLCWPLIRTYGPLSCYLSSKIFRK